MPVKYQAIIKQMYQEHATALAEFKRIHDLYAQDRRAHQDEFNRVGQPIRHLMEEYERRLCGQTEQGIYAPYSHKLAEKFWMAIKKDYPYIDFVGVRMV